MFWNKFFMWVVLYAFLVANEWKIPTATLNSIFTHSYAFHRLDNISLIYTRRWTTRELKCDGRLSINSRGHKNLNISGGVGGSSFESRGGVVGGAIDMQDLQMFCEYTCTYMLWHMLWYIFAPSTLSTFGTHSVGLQMLPKCCRNVDSVDGPLDIAV